VDGTLNFVDLAVAQQTGTLALRAEFPNRRHTLLPGQFVRVSLLGITRTGVIVVPQRAVQQSLNGSFVYVVDSTGHASPRPVAASAWSGNEWIVDSGLRPGDRVVVDGVQKIIPGVPVRTVAYVPPPDTGRDTAAAAVRIAPPGLPLRIAPQ
jgi:membrane fusion protein (multidrug efflux system)